MWTFLRHFLWFKMCEQVCNSEARSVQTTKIMDSRDAVLSLLLIYGLSIILPCDNIWNLDFKAKTNQRFYSWCWSSEVHIELKMTGNPMNATENSSAHSTNTLKPQQCTSASDYGSSDICSLTCCCLPGMQAPEGAATGHSNLKQLNGNWKDTIWEPHSGCRWPVSSARGRKPWTTADRGIHDGQSERCAERWKKENVLETISICISQQRCCFVKGCHTHDFGKQMAQMDAGECYETEM